jgi:hypothetical protein
MIGGCGAGVGTEGADSCASGAINGFGSIIVNGVHFDDSAAQLQDDDGQSLASGTLALGLVARVTAGPNSTAADGSPRAQSNSVHTDRALVGPASAVAAAAGSLRVLGQLVRVSADTVIGARLVGGLAGVTGGQLSEVCGFFNGSRAAYTATRIAPAAISAGYRVSGQVASVEGYSQTFALGSPTYSYASLGSGNAPAPGVVLRLKLKSETDAGGRWQLARRSVGGGPQVLVDADDERRSFEVNGRLSRLDTAARRFVLRGMPISYGRSDLVLENGNAAKLVGYTGRLKGDGQLSADRTLLDAQRIRFDD